MIETIADVHECADLSPYDRNNSAHVSVFKTREHPNWSIKIEVFDCESSMRLDIVYCPFCGDQLQETLISIND